MHIAPGNNKEDGDIIVCLDDILSSCLNDKIKLKDLVFKFDGDFEIKISRDKLIKFLKYIEGNKDG